MPYNFYYVIFCLFHQEDTLSRKEMSQEVFETSVGAQFSSENNLNETTLTELPPRIKDSKNKKMSLPAKLKNLTELCYNIKIKEEQTLDTRQIYIKYNQEIEKEILGWNCLSDMTINLVQSILHQQFLSVLGLAHTEVGLTNMFTVRKNSFLQILHGKYHWVTVFGNKKGEISFYDSLSNGNIPRVFLHQICDITQPATNTISVKVQPVQQ